MENLLFMLKSHQCERHEIQQKFSNLTNKDWDEFVALSKSHKLSNLLLGFLVRNDLIDFVPSNQIKELREKNRQNAIQNIYLLQEAEIILKQFRVSDIEVIGLKGVYLLDNIYEDISMRSMSDLDLMLKKKDIPEAIEIIKKLGYKPSTYFDIRDKNIDIKHVPPMIKNNNLYLEIHWTLLEENEPFTIDIDGLWARAVPAKIAGVDAFALSLEDLILHLCLHLTYQHHLQNGLRGLYDIALVLEQRQSEIDWNVFVDRAKEWHAERVVALTFHLLEDLLEVEIPSYVYMELLQKPIPGEILDQSKMIIMKKTNAMGSVTPDQARFSEDSGLWARVKLVLSRIFLPKITIARLYAIKPDSIKIYYYYLVRFYELMRQYFRSTWRILFKDETVVEDLAMTQSIVDLREWLGRENYHANDVDQWKYFDPTTPHISSLLEFSPGWGYWINAGVGSTWTVFYDSP